MQRLFDWGDINIFYDEQAESWDLQLRDGRPGPVWKHVDYFATEQDARDYAEGIFIGQPVGGTL